MDHGANKVIWSGNVGRQIDALAQALPPQPRLDITVSDFEPLEVLLSRKFLSCDVDILSFEEHWAFLTSFIRSKSWADNEEDLEIRVVGPLAFKSTIDWRLRAIEVERHGHLFRFVHPWDVLVSKLQRLEDKDLEAFKLVIARTGHPTEEEFKRHLQKAVDLYRPKFDEETARGDMLLNTRVLWQTLWQKEIDVRAEIIRPALARAQHDYDTDDPTLKTRLANLKLPDRNQP